MPRVNAFIWQQACTDRLEDTIRRQMKKNKVSQAQLGSLLGVSQQAFGYKLENMTFNWIELVTLFDALNIDGSKVAELSERSRT